MYFHEKGWSKIAKKKYTRAVKCPACEVSFDRNKEPFQHHNNRWYHQACFEKYHASVQDRRNLHAYICELQEIERPTGYILKQIREFEEDYGYSLRGMLTTLRYVHEIEGLPVKKGVGIGIIEYYYGKAVAHYANLIKAQQENSKIKYDNTVKTVYTRPPKRREKKNIDIGGL